MAYERLHWVESETPLSADNMNNIEDGIEELQAQKVDKVSGKALSDNNYTSDEKTKLAGIAAGAEVNVQSDWDQSDSSADDFIKNKPGNASTSTAGLMSAADKAKLNGIAAGANAVKVVKHTVSSATLDAGASTGRVTVTASQSEYSLVGIVGVKIYGPNEGLDRIVRGSTISHMEYPISSTQFGYVIDNGETASITYAVDFYLLYVKN